VKSCGAISGVVGVGGTTGVSIFGTSGTFGASQNKIGSGLGTLGVVSPVGVPVGVSKGLIGFNFGISDLK